MSVRTVVNVPPAVLFHPETRSFPSIATAQAEYGGIPLPVPPALFVDCAQLAGAINIAFVLPGSQKDTKPIPRDFFETLYKATYHNPYGPVTAKSEAGGDTTSPEDALSDVKNDLKIKTVEEPVYVDEEGSIVSTVRLCTLYEPFLSRIEHLEAQGATSSSSSETEAPPSEVCAQRIALMDSALKDAVARLEDLTARTCNMEDKVIALRVKEELVAEKICKIDSIENRLKNEGGEPKIKPLESRITSLEARFSNLPKNDAAKLAKVDAIEKNLSKATSKVNDMERNLSTLDALKKGGHNGKEPCQFESHKVNEKTFNKLNSRVDTVASRLDALVTKVDKFNVKLAAMDKGADNTAIKELEAEVKDLETAIEQLNVTQSLAKDASDSKMNDFGSSLEQQIKILDQMSARIETVSDAIEKLPKEATFEPMGIAEATDQKDETDTPSPASEEWDKAEDDDISVFRDRES